MNTRSSRLTLTVLSAAVLGVFSAEAPGKPKLETGQDAEITHDGLYRVDKTVMDAAWVKPDLDLTPYKKLLIGAAGMSFKPVDDEGQRWWPGRSDQTEFPISEENKVRLQEEMGKAFLEELADLRRYEIVGEPGEGVLLLAVALIDVVSSVPPVDECIGRCDVYLSSVGEATLVLELRDSVTNEVLARAADRRAAEQQGWPIEANSVTVWPEVERLAHAWGKQVRKRLDEFESVDDLAR